MEQNFLFARDSIMRKKSNFTLKFYQEFKKFIWFKFYLNKILLFVIFGYEKLRLLFFFWYFKNLCEKNSLFRLNFKLPCDFIAIKKIKILLLINLWRIFWCETRVFPRELIIPSKKILFYTFFFLNISLNILIQNKKKKLSNLIYPRYMSDGSRGWHTVDGKTLPYRAVDFLFLCPHRNCT